MNVLPEIELINFQEMWEVIGPFIIMGITIVVLGLIAAVSIGKKSIGSIGKIAIGFIVVGAFVSLFITSDIWGN